MGAKEVSGGFMNISKLTWEPAKLFVAVPNPVTGLTVVDGKLIARTDFGFYRIVMRGKRRPRVKKIRGER